jgi:hypothetical protein
MLLANAQHQTLFARSIKPRRAGQQAMRFRSVNRSLDQYFDHTVTVPLDRLRFARTFSDPGTPGPIRGRLVGSMQRTQG